MSSSVLDFRQREYPDRSVRWKLPKGHLITSEPLVTLFNSHGNVAHIVQYADSYVCLLQHSDLLYVLTFGLIGKNNVCTPTYFIRREFADAIKYIMEEGL